MGPPIANEGYVVTGSSVLLIPAGGDPQALARTKSVLDSHQLSFVISAPDAIHLLTDRSPTLVVVHGRSTDAAASSLITHLSTLTARRTPVLVLMEQVTEDDEAALLHLGAHSVLPLPVATQRLRARILAMLRCSGRRLQSGGDPCARGNLRIHMGRREVNVGTHAVALTRIEFDLLVALARNPRRVLSRHELTERVLAGSVGTGGTLESHLDRLRRKIKSVDGPSVIGPLGGPAYRLGI